jgi:hypothetical protein
MASYRDSFTVLYVDDVRTSLEAQSSAPSLFVCPGPRLIDTFHNKLAFYGEGLLVPRPTPKL